MMSIASKPSRSRMVPAWAATEKWSINSSPFLILRSNSFMR
jgi:hypothetical protein